MSFQNKGFWTVKGSGHINDRETTFDNPSKVEPKRPHQWFVDSAEVDLFPNKKQAVEDVNGKSSSGFSNVNYPPWDNSSGFSVSNIVDQLFGSETRQVNVIEKNVYVPAGSSNVRSRAMTNQYGDNSSIGLSISHSVENSEAPLNYGGVKKVKVSQVKDIDGVRHHPEGLNYNMQSNGDLHQVYGGEIDKDGNVTLMGLAYNGGDVHVRSSGAPYGKGGDTGMSFGTDSYSKDNTNVIPFGGFPDERGIIPAGRPAADYGQLYNQSSVHIPGAGHEKELDASNPGAVANTPQVVKQKSETVSKNKQESKANKKESPNSFPTNVRSLISTGMLDGVPVKYVSAAREMKELRGIIKGSGYLCGCKKCNYSKALNAYEFERHANCKSKHPNNHIYFDNGKTIYQIVQELKSTPESMLFDTIQTVFGAPINQKAFRYWKESYQAATRELQRIYGKE
ncbi:uncharacterized protein LOC130965321 isoform X1 [Arachis stenosperma]|uniref:uncharacterized protein LOC130965321 isoform X1 n=1 Tax=Arachis stenosperma TaxID=217475 RepID=UPI0025AC6C18|nr:uncharacterized protein LOC130965321 isoform X1 [Arachis stenosperma]